MLSAETLDLLRQWWKARPSRCDAGTPVAERWLFPGNRPGKPMTTRQLNGVSVRGNVLDFESNDIATAQFAVDGEIE
jgi:integrase